MPEVLSTARDSRPMAVLNTEIQACALNDEQQVFLESPSKLEALAKSFLGCIRSYGRCCNETLLQISINLQWSVVNL